MTKFIVLFFLILITCKDKAINVNEILPTNHSKDIWGENEFFAEGKYDFIDLEKLKFLKQDESTEEEIYEIYGRKINVRLSYTVSPVARKYKGKYIPIDKIIMYFDAKGTSKEIPNGKVYKTFEKLSVTFFLYKNKLQFHSIRHRDSDADIILKDSTQDVIEFEKISFGDLWPNQLCDRNYYDHTVFKIPKNELSIGQVDCEWQLPNFEKKLKKDGYYEKLK